jgi:hypothetical protein
MGMEWFLLIIVGFLVWALLSNPLIRGNITQSVWKARKTSTPGSRLLHPRFKG